MTLYEYALRMRACGLRYIDEIERMHEQAWLNQKIQATKSVGSGKAKKEVPVYSTFKKFFDKEQAENEFLGKNTQQDTKLMDLIKKANT